MLDKDVLSFRRRFVKDFNLPINLVDSPYFEYYMERYDFFPMEDWNSCVNKINSEYDGNVNKWLETYSTIRDNIITTIAEKYSPDEFRLYLLDYKLGVEFKIYKDHPNVEFLLLDNNRLSAAIDALKMLENEMQKREILFEEDLTIQDIEVYNKKAKHRNSFRVLQPTDGRQNNNRRTIQ